MEFFIRQGASDPILKMRMIDDGKNDKSSFNDLLENAEITFEMVKEEFYYMSKELKDTDVAPFKSGNEYILTIK